jgi:outer membrane receptor protein involved in Fe transport
MVSPHRSAHPFQDAPAPPAAPRSAPETATLARSPQRLTAAPISVARQAAPTLARSPAAANAPAPAAGGGGGGGGGGSDSDAAYHELLRRVRDEREQLGQLIPHPF